MPESILNSTKKLLGLAEDYDVFDTEIAAHINSAFGTLHQLGVGPAGGFFIEGDTETWDAFLPLGPLLSLVKTYVYLRTRLLFDPPASGFATTAQKEQIKELEWRINSTREETSWTPPTIPV